MSRKYDRAWYKIRVRLNKSRKVKYKGRTTLLHKGKIVTKRRKLDLMELSMMIEHSRESGYTVLKVERL